jgi:flagellar basal body rod protein FlgG
MDANGIALSGLQSAALRLAASAHAVANLNTDGFRPLRVTQSAVPGGGVAARVAQAPSPEPVDLAQEIAAQIQARAQFIASLRVFLANRALDRALLEEG